jgi:H+/Cl- antiporter ClcA
MAHSTAGKPNTGKKISEMNRAEALGDFTATPRMALLSVIAIVIGLLSTGVAWVLLRLIGFFTNLLYYGRIEFKMVSPANNTLGWLAVLIPVAGGIVVGLMARYGSERIRGHGIPEALESILLNGSKVQPRLAILKPISSAIAIGSGGPFGAEGPIIMTGGAFGSIIAQLFRLSSVERKTLLVAGAAAGMSATFAAPVASTLLALELLLFEFKPRSAVPVALAAATAGAARRYLLGLGPLFPVPQHSVLLGPAASLPASSRGCFRSRSRKACMRWRTCSTSCRCTGCGGLQSAAWWSGSAA